ncbi:hypothetical protein G9E11_12220 [Arthrobacter sp. IA7]|uniref:hypothetical protein n=1 Tax=Arthrobacter ipis TaxID=2716202 RepID=UPI0016885A4B|nr:hypothetical protein [Arthrobacter ipis]MBD1542997.1 hypothetical protein [Arthrobacter ipis]
MTQQPLSRSELKELLQRKIEGIEEPPQDDENEQQQQPASATGGTPAGLNEDTLLLGLASKLGFDATTMNTITSRDRGIDNPL